MRGWFLKYRIEKLDGSQIDPNADYFVLRLDNHEPSQAAALAYADAIEAENPLLATDLRDRVKRYTQA